MSALGDPRLPERFWTKVRVGDSGCWLWIASLDKWGYGKFAVSRRSMKAHRVAYCGLVEPLASAVELDHTCHSTDPSCAGGVSCLHRRCVNPAHLEPVTHYQNGRRSVPSRKTHCVNGHEFTPENTYDRTHLDGNYGARACRACNRDAAARYYAKKASA